MHIESKNRLGDMNGGWQILFKVALAMFPVCITVSAGYAVGVNRDLSRHESKLAAMEASGFTMVDGNRLCERIVADNTDIWRSIADLKITVAKIPSESPPKWFVDRMNKLEAKVDAIEAKVK